ncbi:1-acyl-sn-glycerol-3-phosphate acyltransferase [Bacillus sp. AGMB 02131]|uniref:1-acyl-sn-glycerol-3-phosphate acyltransferase n=1 Tax=Peribacillus faecalis TaxID=2772559 RepID=A0A927D0C3_9BACI|nr:lysophospholipid acyltransferase family protein [Peribacillus faecalis]MBD3110374.1 1-acyl-sn-glycerol-3-phosphate acyltransferase [Peribacillus faecalis]
MSLYSFAKNLVYAVLKPIYRFDVIGRENFPKDGGVLLCANHISVLDPPVVGINAPRTVHFMAKEELFETPILKHLLPGLNAFPVKRGMSDREALRKGLSILREGKVLGIFPEGTRSETGELQKGLAGCGFFALRTDALVVPCAIIGPYKKFKRLKVVYGQPIDFSVYKNEGKKLTPEEATEIIMGEIAKLINEYK